MKTDRFIVKFYHNSGNKKDDTPVGTRVVIINRNSEEIITDVTARLYFKDKFSRKAGRKAALKKTFEEHDDLFSRLDRSEIWHMLQRHTKM